MSVVLLLTMFVAVGLAGCRQKPYLKMENRSETGNSAGSAIGAPDVKVVTGEPAPKTEASESDAVADTAKDKTGAVAVKMEY